MHGNRTLHPWLPSPDRSQSGECHRRLFLQVSYTARLRRLAIGQMPTLAAIRNATRNRQTARSLTRPKRRLQVSAAPPAASSGAGHTTLTWPGLCGVQPKNFQSLTRAVPWSYRYLPVLHMNRDEAGSTDSSSSLRPRRGPHGHAVEARNPKAVRQWV